MRPKSTMKKGMVEVNDTPYGRVISVPREEFEEAFDKFLSEQAKEKSHYASVNWSARMKSKY